MSAAEPLVVVRARRHGDVATVVHLLETVRRRAACRQGSASSSTLRADAVTCGSCRRTRAYAVAVATEAAERRVLERVAAAEARRVKPDATPWACHLCEGSGDDGGGRCLHCAGNGYVAAEADGCGLGPRPPAVMARPCADCRFRPDSQEDEQGLAPPDGASVFWCHQGVPLVAGEYRPLLWAGGMPVGSKVCGAWWDVVACGRDAPSRPAVYRDGR